MTTNSNLSLSYPQIAIKRKRKAEKTEILHISTHLSLIVLKQRWGESSLRSWTPHSHQTTRWRSCLTETRLSCPTNACQTWPKLSQPTTRSSWKKIKTMEGCATAQGAPSAPLGGQCLRGPVVYRAAVTTNNSTEYYTGIAGNSFKERWDGHNTTLRHSEKRNETTLSQHIWDLEDSGTNYRHRL